MPGKSSVIQQPASKLNVVPIASTATCVPLQSIAVQQPTISSNAMSKVSDGLRKWYILGTSVNAHFVFKVLKKKRKKLIDFVINNVIDSP